MAVTAPPAEHAAQSNEKQLTTTLDISGMTCASCVRRVERALSKVEGVEQANVNFASETALVMAPAGVAADALIAAVEKAGYHAQVSEPSRERGDERTQHARRTLLLTLFGAALAIPAVVLAMGMDIAGVYLAGSERATAWTVLGLVTPIQVVLGWRYYRGSVASLRHLNPNMDVLIALGTSVAFAYSAWVVISDQPYQMFLDVSAAVLVFITMGKYFEERSKGQASSAIQKLLGMSAKTARVIRDGAEVELPVERLAPGDVFVVRPGEKVAVDGVVREGHSTLDESMITGESIPVERKTGEAVIGGTINQNGVIRVEATAVGGATVLARMAKLGAEAQGSKEPIQKLVDQVAAVFVPVVIVIAAGTILSWGLFTEPAHAWSDSQWIAGMRAAVAVLVIACPCALGLATPTAIMVGTGIGAERGILIKNAEVLERTRQLDVIVLDKTGTLTEGRPQVTEAVPVGLMPEAVLLTLAGAAEQNSDHPLSRAIVDAAVEAGYVLPATSEFESLTALGVVAVVEEPQILTDSHRGDSAEGDGAVTAPHPLTPSPRRGEGESPNRTVIAGNRRLMEERGIAVEVSAQAEVERLEGFGRTVIYVAVDGRLEGVIGIADEIKRTAARAIESLRGLGLRVVMMTGDNERAAAAVAQAVGVDEYRAGAKPEDKIELVRSLQAEGLSVAMVGDGVNDAPALAQADIGIAMSTGTDVAIEAGDITLLHGDISKVAEAIALSRQTLTTIKQNLFWAFGYNVVAIPVAALGLLNPIIAGAAMAFSSVSVMSNSLRLRSKAKGVAKGVGNAYAPARGGLMSTTGAPALAMLAAVGILLVPLSIFTAIDRGWFESAEALGPRDVRAELRNFKVDLSREEMAEGDVYFVVEHTQERGHRGGDGPGEMHDLVVVRRDASGTTRLMGQTLALHMGESQVMRLDLAPGEYELFCSVVEEIKGEVVNHMEEGMHAAFRVTAAQEAEGEARVRE